MDAHFGWVKPSQVNKAVELLKSGWIYEAGGNLDGVNIWVERPHQGDNVRGAFFKNRIELIGTEQSYKEFNDLKEYLSKCEEEECRPDEKIINLLKKGSTIYIIVSENGSIVIGDDKNKVIDDAISDGRGSEYFTIHEAIEALENENYNDTLAIWLLKFVSENDEE